MADEIDAGRIVAEIVLETQQAKENAEEFSGITLSYIESSLGNLGIKGQKATDMIQQGFASLVKQDSFNVNAVNQYISALENLSEKIKNCEERKEVFSKVNDTDGIERSSQAIEKLNQMYTSVQTQLDGYIAKMVKVVQTENEINELAGISMPDVVTEEVTLNAQSYADTIEYIRNELNKLGITGEKAEKIISSCFQDVDNLKKYQNNLEVLSSKIETAKNRYQKLAKARLIAEKQGNTSEIDKMTSAMEKQANTIKSLEAQFDNTYIQMNSVVKKSVSNYNKQAEAAQKSADKQAKAAEKASQKQLELNKQLANRQAGKDFAGSVNLATTSLRTFNTIVPDTIDGIGEIVTQINMAKQAISMEVSKPLAWGTAIVASIGVVANLVANEIQKVQQAEEEARQKAVEVASEYENNSKSLKTLVSQYQEAKSKLETYNLSHNDEISIKNELLSMQQDLIDTYSDEASGIDLVNGSLSNEIENIKKLSVQEAELYQLKNRTKYNDIKDYMENTQTLTLATGRTDKLNDAGLNKRAINILEGIDGVSISYTPQKESMSGKEYKNFTIKLDVDGKDLEDKLKEINDKVQDLRLPGQEFLENITNIYNSTLGDTYAENLKIYNQWQKAQEVINSNGKSILGEADAYTVAMKKISEYKSSMSDLYSVYKTVSEGGKLNSETLQDLCYKYPEIGKYISETGDVTLKNGELLKKTYESEQDAAKKAINAEIARLNALRANGEATPEQEEEFFRLRNMVSLYNNDIMDLQNSVDVYTDKMNNLSSAYKAVSNGGELDSDTLQDLIAQYPKLAEYVSQTGDLTLANGEKIKEAYEEEQKALIEKLTVKKQELELEKESSDSKEEVTKQIAQINAQLEIYKNAQIEIDSNGVDWSSTASEVKSLASAYRTLNEGKQLDVDTMIQLIDKYPEVATAMANEGKLGKEQANVFKTLFEAKKQDYILTQQSAIDNLKAKATETQGVIANIQSQIIAYQALGNVVGIVGINATAQLAGLNALLLKNQSDYDSYMSDINKIQARIKAIQNMDIDTYGASSGGGSGSDRNEALANELKRLEHKKAIGQLTSKQEYDWLVRINNRYRKNADEQMDMEKRLYNAKKQMQADEEAANTKALQAAYKGIENKKSLGRMTSQQELKQLEQIRQKYKMTADERMELEIKIYNLKKSLKDEEISSINTLADAVTEALKEKYEEQRKIEEDRINESIESWQKWEDKTVEAVQGEIDALDELADKQESENKRQEYENKRQQTELQLAYEKDDYNRQQLQKELNRLDKEEAERLAEEQRQAQKKALEGRIDAVKGQSQASQERLKNQLNEVGERYDKLTDSFSLKAQAQKLIANSTQKDIVNLIKSYASDYEIAGNTVGDALYNGMKAKMDNITAYVDGIFSKIEVYQRQVANTANAAADRFWESQSSAQTSHQPASKSVNVQQTVNFNRPVESPVETRRQLDRTNQALAQQISSGI